MLNFKFDFKPVSVVCRSFQLCIYVKFNLKAKRQ